MKMKKIAILAMTSLLLIGCSNGGQSGGSSSNQDSNSSENNSQNESQDSNSSSEEYIDETITLKMVGDLYINNMRRIYAQLENGTRGKIIWESDNPDVVDVSEHGLSAVVIGKSVGTATISCYLEKHPSVRAEKTFVLTEGTPIETAIFDKLMGGLKVHTIEQQIMHDKDWAQEVYKTVEINTVFEESFESAQNNYTDGYYLDATVKLADPSREKTQVITYVSDEDGYVSTEVKDIFNQVKLQNVSKEGSKIRWAESPYFNFFADEEEISYEDFRTFDGGKTYHFVGRPIAGASIAISLWLDSVEPDDIYLTVENDELKLYASTDPFDIGDGSEYRYSRKFVSTFSDFGTAKMKHVLPYEFNDTYHPQIQNALDELANGKNYSVSYTLDYEGQIHDARYDFTFTKDDVYVEKYINGSLTFKNGAHHTEGDGYINYDVNLENGKIKVKTTKKTGWNKFGGFMKFNFSPAILKEVSANSFTTIDDGMGEFVRTCLIANGALGQMETTYGHGNLTLTEDSKHLSTISTTLDWQEEEVKVNAEFSNIGTSKVNIDFNNIDENSYPQSWKEDDKSLYNDMVKWGIENVVPYMYNPFGYNGGVGVKYRDNAHSIVSQVYIDTRVLEETNDFNTTDAFVTEYKKLLIEEGWVLTDTTDPDSGYPLYKKGGYFIGVGRGYRIVPSRVDEHRARIVVISGNLINPDF